MEMKHGILLIDKPKGETSFRQISKLRAKLDIKKVGHCGTLDPLATGLLVLCVGKATKIAQYLTNDDKEYIAEIQFGYSTTTDDCEGEVLNKSDRKIDKHILAELLRKKFTGEISQIPPNFSAIKINGKRAYKLARENKSFDIKARKVNINAIELITFDKEKQRATLRIECSKGTYIRSIARDLGQALNTYAHLHSLVRTKSGQFCLNSNRCIEDIDSADREKVLSNIIPMSESMNEYRRLVIKVKSGDKAKYGRVLSKKDIDWMKSDVDEMSLLDSKGLYRLCDVRDVLLALIDGKLDYKRVFV